MYNATPAPAGTYPPPRASPRPGLDLARHDGVQLVALGAVTLVGGGFLAAMFAVQAQGGSGDPWGP
ncbi:hypothetical protein [Tessaracoccus coleopterorum]|uniref:hypothetical protein n=1 Tax=Tessaracoccus coleopterorum TaxID=2714950 RepID=UPI0018D2EDD6|nr:hypothetical protein [Tessaracoccus coleopterorum]